MLVAKSGIYESAEEVLVRAFGFNANLIKYF